MKKESFRDKIVITLSSGKELSCLQVIHDVRMQHED